MQMTTGGEHTDVMTLAAMRPSRVSEDGSGGRSFIQPLRTIPIDDSVANLGAWRAEPGVYSHPGDPVGESFVLVTGQATLRLADGSEYPLTPGTFVTIPPNTASQIEVEETLVKVSLTIGA